MTETPQLLLAHHLKTLKLPTFLREYDKVARQCASEGVDHVRYLLRLAELNRHEHRQTVILPRCRANRIAAVLHLASSLIPSPRAEVYATYPRTAS